MITIQFPETVPNVPTVPFSPDQRLDVWQPLSGRYVIKASKNECLVVLRMAVKDRPFCIDNAVLCAMGKGMHIEVPIKEASVRLWAWADQTPDEYELWRCDKQRPDLHPELASIWTLAYITSADAVCGSDEEFRFVVTVAFLLQPKAIDPQSMPLAVEVDKVVMALSGKVPRYVTVERVPKADTKATHTADGEVIADMGGKQPTLDFSNTTLRPVADPAPAAPGACDDVDDSTTDQAAADAAGATAETPACDDGNDGADNLCMNCHAAPIDGGDTTWCSGCLAELKVHQEAQVDARRQWLTSSAAEYLNGSNGRTCTSIATWLKNAQYRFQPSWVADTTIGALAAELEPTLELDPRFDVCNPADGLGKPMWVLIEADAPAASAATEPPAPAPEPEDPAPGSYAKPRPEHVDLGDLTIDHIVHVLRNSNGSLVIYNMTGALQQHCKVSASQSAVRAVAAQRPDIVELGPMHMGSRQRVDLVAGTFELEVAMFVRGELEGLTGKACSLTALGQRVSKRWALKGDSIGRAWLDKALLANPQWFVRVPGKPVRLREAVDG